MTKDEFTERVKMILQVHTLSLATSLEDADSFSRVELIMTVEEFNGKQLHDFQVKSLKTFQDLLYLIET